MRCWSRDPAVSAIIFWFPRLCHLSERLRSSGGAGRGGLTAPGGKAAVSGGLRGVTVGPMSRS